MLKLTVKPGEYIDIGKEIRVVFAGGSANNLHILVDAPRDYNIVRSGVLEKNMKEQGADVHKIRTYHKDAELSNEAKEKIQKIISEERFKQKQKKHDKKNVKVKEH
ncbi:MAG: carbon storage regulator [Lachnospiraceae bacterium]|nr:carbon storage regulator [Lachnospiraceae bacterium]